MDVSLDSATGNCEVNGFYKETLTTRAYFTFLTRDLLVVCISYILTILLVGRILVSPTWDVRYVKYWLTQDRNLKRDQLAHTQYV